MTPNSRPPDDQALDRFLAGQSTVEEAAAVRAWLDESGRHEEVLAAVHRAAAREPASFSANTEAALAAVRRRIDVERDAQTATRFRAVRWAPILAAAAAVLVIAGTVVTSNRIRSGESTSFQTARGERRTFTLGDGSEMVLAPGSRATFSEAQGGRRIDLDGEAFFRVTHDETRPFTVVARNATATDIGTEFVVRSYTGDPSVDIAVAEGVVAVSSTNRTAGRAILRKGDVARVDAAGTPTVRSDLELSAYTAWTTGRLVFQDAPLSSIAADLSRWFDANISVTDSTLARQRLTAVYDKPTLDDVLAALAATTGATIERAGNGVQLVKNPTP